MDAYAIQKMMKDGLKDHVTSSANPAIWSLCQQISTASKALVREAVKEVKEKSEAEAKAKEKELHTPSRLLTDEERTEALTKFLDGKLLDGTLSAAELAQFKDIYGLKAKDKDVTIKAVDFKEALPESYEALKLVEKAILSEINRINA